MTDRVTAGILYLILGGFALAALALFVPWPFSWEVLSSVPDAKVLAAVLSGLGVASVALALVFLTRRHPISKLPNWPSLTVGVALPLLALGWNYLAPLFWILPLIFVWRASKVSGT
jgi:hypothetical protein